MNQHFRRTLLTASILSAVFTTQVSALDNDSVAQPADPQPRVEQAQDSIQPTPAKDSSKQTVQLQNVTVTAMRREEQIQTVPMGITSLDPVQIQREQVATLNDLKISTPNLVIMPNPGGGGSGLTVFMRGIGQDQNNFTADQGVALYVNDVLIPRQNGAMLDLYDVERVEVLRGPQGTLYGRNATGGAIRYVTRKPDGKDKLTLDTKLGNLGRADARVRFGTRLGSIDISGAVMTLNRDGYMRNVLDGRKINDSKKLGAITTLATSLGDNTYASLSLDYLKDDSGPNVNTPVHLDDKGKLLPDWGSFYNTRVDVPGTWGLKQGGAVLHTDTDFGWVSLRNIFQWRFSDYDTISPGVKAATASTPFQSSSDNRQWQYGYEAQLASQMEGPFSWVGGFFWFHEANSAVNNAANIFTNGLEQYQSQQTNALALYWQGTYTVTDRLSLITGARYSWEQKRFLSVTLNRDKTTKFTWNPQRIWTNPDWKVGINYDFTPKVMGYATITTGFKSGGYNGAAQSLPAATTVAPEKLLAYEIGLKGSIWDDRGRIAVDYYRYDYSAMQLSSIDNAGILKLANTTGALVQGVEMDAQFQLTSQWQMGVGFGTISGEYKDYAPEYKATYYGHGLKNAPKYKWHMSTTYIHPLETADLVFSAQLMQTDIIYHNVALSRVIMTPVYLDANARVAYEPQSKRWSLALWGKNLTNNHVATTGFDIPGLGTRTIWPTPPRTYGLDFTYNFF